MPTQDVKAKIPSAFEDRDEKKNNPFSYSKEETDYRGFVLDRLIRARNQREEDHIEFDDASYLAWHVSNAKASNSYNPPRKNREDTRIVTGTTQEKENTVLSSLLNFNFEGNIQAFDKHDNEIYELGENVEELVKKSRKMEKYDQKRLLYYKELLDQGTCFIEEVKKDQIIVEKEMVDKNWAMGGVKVGKIKWEKKIKKLYASCETNLLSGTSVFLGNIKEFFLHKQPYAFIQDVIHYDEAKMLYGDWDRWKYVPKKTTRVDSVTSDNVEYRDFSLLSIDENYVEVIKYQDPINNEFMIFLNGVMMLPIGFPLTAISPSGRLTFAKGDAEPISKFFAYSKSLPAKTKVDQEMLDEILKMVLLKMKKSLWPPMANNTGRNLTRKIFLPAEITNGINPEKIQEIGTNTGPTAAEFNTFQLMRQLVNEKSLDPVFSGDQQGQPTTATETIQRKQQQMLKLGQTVVGVVNLEIQLIELRIHNILANWTKPVDQRVDEVRNALSEVYRTFMIDTTFEDTGKKGTRIISFNPEATEQYSTPDGEADLRRKEDEIKKKTGKDVRFTFMSGEAIRNFGATFYVDVTPTEKASSELDRTLFKQDWADAMTLFGPQSVNQEYGKLRFATLAKEDPDKFFNQAQQPQQPPEQGGALGELGGKIGQQLQQGMGKQQQPSLNTLMSG